MQVNSVSHIGHMSADPELKYTASGKAVCNFNLAVDDGFGENKKTLWIRVTCWGQTAETAQKYAGKGHRVGITGRITQETFTRQGSDREETKTGVTCERLDLLEPKKDGGQPTPQQRPEPRNHAIPSNRPGAATPADDYADEDDIPF